MKNNYTFIIRFVYFNEANRLHIDTKTRKLLSEAYLSKPIEYTVSANTFEKARTKALEYGQSILRDNDALAFMRIGTKE